MIIAEPTSQSPLKPQQQLNEQGSRPNNPPQSPPPYVPSPEYLPTVQSHHVGHRQSPSRRFFEAFCVAVAIYVLAGMFMSSVTWNMHRGRHRRPSHQDQVTWLDDVSKTWPIPPSDGPALYGESSVRMTFDLPVSSDAIYLLAQGSLSGGNIAIIDSVDGPSDTVQIDVVANYYNQNSLDRTNVCLLQRKPHENGVGIFTPAIRKHAKRDALRFDIKVYLPVGHSRLRINAFETYLPLFRHDIGDLDKTVEFQRLSLMGSDLPIFVRSISANSANITTSNSPIIGSFNTTTSLKLHTSNSFITTNVSLLNDPSGDPTELAVITNSGRIDSIINLSSSRSTGGSFKVNTSTSNEALSVKYDTSPVASILRHDAHTSNSLATVSLHSAYEGPFTLESNLSSSVRERHEVEDPSGKGRSRSVTFLNIGDLLIGDIHWGWEKKLYGANVHISTTNLPVRLHV